MNTDREPAQHWQAWHRDYADPNSALSRRLRLVQHHISTWLDTRSETELRAVSACAGQGHDLLGVLAGRTDGQRVRACLLEFDAVNADIARAAAAAGGLDRVEVRCADAGDLSAYAGAVPADLVLFVGVFGNISPADIERSIHALPRLCAAGATVIWTRTRREPDLTPTVRAWFGGAGFDEIAFEAPDGILISVGVHRLRAEPRPLAPYGTIFAFVNA